MSDKEYILSIDAGTTSVKTVLFDTYGTEIVSKVNEYELKKPAPDFLEVDPETYWQAAVRGIAGIMRESGVLPERIRAVGVTSQGETLIVLDSNGRPLRNAIVWLDNRSVREAKHIAQHFDRKTVYEITGQQEIVPTWTVTKIMWLREHEPDVFRRAAKFLLVEDYLIYRLTGVYATAHSLCPSTLYYDLKNGCWWKEMLDFAGISSGQLPELKNAGDTVGNVSADIGLSKNTAVTVAPIDQVAATVGSGNIIPGMVTETTGSALAVCAALTETVCDPQMRIGLFRHAVKGQYILMPWVPTAGMVLRWFRDEFCDGMDYSAMSELAGKVQAGSDGLITLPHLSGAFCPDVNPAARGVFYGMTMSHKRGHFIRSIFESVAFMLRDCVVMLEELGIDSQKVYSLGGGSRSQLWLQIKADVLNKTIVVPESREATCLGTAVLAAHGTGIYSSLEDAVRNMVRFEKEYTPSPKDAELYNTYYNRYRDLSEMIIPTFS